jgi:Tfp pilus assembly protein PilX
MKCAEKTICSERKATVLIIAMIFILVFSMFAISLAAMSASSVEVSSNQHKINSALTAAQSGLEVMRYCLSNMTISGTVQPQDRLANVASQLQTRFADVGMADVTVSYDAATDIVTISTIPLDSQSNESFTASLSYAGDFNTARIDVIGSSQQIYRRIQANYNFATTGSGAFDFGVTSKGPLYMSGQAELEGKNLAIEASVYVDGDWVTSDAFSITSNACVAGDVSIANPYSTYRADEKSSVGGATGKAIADHVHIGTEYVDFPTPNPACFRTFATGEQLNKESKWDDHAVLNNVVIKANANPTFSGDVTINGILFIEAPNIVHFGGKCTVNAIIVAAGDVADASGSNSISFAGQVVCNDISTLKGTQFDAIKRQTGTFILAPGFSLAFSGNSLAMSGAIAANGISFSGQAGGTIKGSLINYSSTPTTLGGQSSLMFNRSGRETNPAGFVSDYALEFQPSSYSEVSF